MSSVQISLEKISWGKEISSLVSEDFPNTTAAQEANKRLSFRLGRPRGIQKRAKKNSKEAEFCCHPSS